MTLQQQAYKQIDRMSEDGIKFFLDLIDKMDELSNIQFFSPTGSIESNDESSVARSIDVVKPTEAVSIGNAMESEPEDNLKDGGDGILNIIDSLSPADIAGMSKADKKKLFFQSGGKLDYDEDAYWALRERSMV